MDSCPSRTAVRGYYEGEFGSFREDDPRRMAPACGLEISQGREHKGTSLFCLRGVFHLQTGPRHPAPRAGSIRGT